MCMPTLEQQSFEFVHAHSAFFSGLVGVIIGALLTAWLTSRREQKQRKLAFLEKQLSVFYSPMLGLRNEIKTHSDFRVHVQNEAGTAWEELCKEFENLGIETRQRITKERWPGFKRIIDYDNTKFQEELLPTYQKMVELFRDYYWLVELETRVFYIDLLEFVEVWNRWNDQALPVEVLERLGHGESKLVSFYAHIEQMHDAIRQKLKDGMP